MPTTIKSLKDAESAVGALETRIEKLAEEKNTVEKEVRDQIHAAKDKLNDDLSNAKESIDQKISQRVNTALVFAAVILAVGGAVGYFGLSSLIQSTVKTTLGESAKAELQKLQAEAEAAMAVIRKARESAIANPLIVLQTDYGTNNPYMGRLMGVIYDINPSARIQVVSAQIENFDVLHAAWTLWRAARFYPTGTIFVVITNPGGMTATPIVIRTKNGHIYIGHDNGCFDLVVENFGFDVAYSIASPKLSPPRFKDLFGGIDVFGPAAAEIAKGFKMDDVGPKSPVYGSPRLSNVVNRIQGDKLSATVMDVDGYGNATMSTTEQDLEKMQIRVGAELMVKFKSKAGPEHTLQIPVKATYGNVSKGHPVGLIYEGLLQFAVNEESFGAKYGAQRGTVLTIEKK